MSNAADHDIYAFEKAWGQKLWHFPTAFSQVVIESNCLLETEDLSALKQALEDLSEKAWMQGLSLEFVRVSGKAPKGESE